MHVFECNGKGQKCCIILVASSKVNILAMVNNNNPNGMNW